MDAGDWVGVALGGAGLILAIFVANRQIRMHDQQTRMQARLTAIETARRAEELEARWQARIRVAATKPGRSHDTVVVVNDGPARAHLLGVHVEAADQGSRPDVDGLEVLPRYMQAGDRLSFRMARHVSTTDALQVVVTWTDDAGRHEEAFTVSDG